MAKVLSRNVVIYVDGKQVDSTIKSLQAELKKLQNRQKNLTIGTDEYIQTSLKMREIQNVLRENTRALQKQDTQLELSLNKISNLGNMITGIQSLFAMGDAAVGSLKDIAKAATELDDAYADVMKTTGLTHDEVERLNQAFRDIDTRTSREQLNQLAYEAGKLGISSREAVEQFVKAADKINIALGDVLGDGAMVTIGKLADIYSRATDTIAEKDLEGRMLALGSAINSLGQASTANEAYMVDFMSRLGGIADQAGLTADQILGYASAFDQANLAVEMSATAFQKLIQQMISKPEEFIDAARMPLNDFRRMLETDMNGAIQRVLKGMDEMGGFQQLLPIFKDMGLDGARAASAVSALAGSLDKVTAAQSLANEQLLSGASIEEEFATKNSSLQAQADKAKKAFEDMRIELGQQLYPVVIQLTKSSTMAIKGLSGYLNLWRDNRAAAIALTGTLATLVGWYTRAYLVKLKDKAVDIATMAQKKAVTAITNLQTAVEARHTAQLEKSRLATLKQQLAVQQKIIADKAEYQAMGANAVVLAAERNSRFLSQQITAQQVVATNAHTAAVKANKLAMASTPWGAVIAAVAALTAGIVKLVKHQTRFRTETRELNKQIASESQQAKFLFDKLKNLDQKSQEYKDTLSKLNDLYPDILAHYTDEEGRLTNLAAARQAVIDKIREQIIEQRKLDRYSQIAGDFAEDTDKTKERIYKTMIREAYSKEVGERQYQSILSVLPSSYDAQVDLSKLIADVNKAVGANITDNVDGLVTLLSKYAKIVNKAYKEQNQFEAIYGDKKGITPFRYIDKSKPITSDSTQETSTPSAISDEAKKAAERAAKELLEKGEKNAEAASKLLNALATKYTVPTVQSELALLDKQIETIAQGLEEAFAKKGKDGGITWMNEEMHQLHENLLANQQEMRKGVINDWVQKLGAETSDLQQRLNDLGMVDLTKVAEIDPEAAQDLQDLIEYFSILKENADKAAQAINGVQEATNSESWQDTLKDIADNIYKFSDSALKMWDHINTIITNVQSRTLAQVEEDTKQQQQRLQDNLAQGLISQEEYNIRSAKLDEDFQEKKKDIERQEFNRNKALSIAQSSIAAAVAIMRVLADPTFVGPARWAQLALVATESALQIAAIASQPAPYAKGGYTREPQILVGERGQEWVASNRLLRDPATAPLINALEQYQRGTIGMSAVNMQAVGTVAENRKEETIQLKLLNQQMAQLAKYLSDPRNRQAVISRQTQEKFDRDENFLRSAARL